MKGKLASVAGTVTVATSLCWIAAMLINPILQPQLDPRVYWISEYGIGPQGWVQNGSFFAASLGIVALVVGLLARGPRSWLCRSGVAILSILIPGMVVSGLFHTDARGLPETVHGLVHDMSAYANMVGGVAAQILISASFGDDSDWRPIRGPSIIVATLCVVVLVTQFLSVQLRFHWNGVINHLLAGLLAVWWLTVALRLRKFQAA